MTRELLVGGSFDPVHNGHLIVARAAAEKLNCNRVILVPAAQSPHKSQLTSNATPPQRLEMLRLAVAGDSYFDISTAELERPPPSFTVETIEKFLSEGRQDLHWLIGADQLAKLPLWHRAAELVQKVTFVIAARPGHSVNFDALPPEFRNLRNNVVETPVLEISSTHVRQRVRDGKSIRYFVPDAVEGFILANNLYK
jgi:nicotinate-nucleotide adenylyltransferase